jgi:inosose dehydratase
MEADQDLRVGCQTIVWGSDAIREDLPRVLKEVAGCGYQGVEIGARHLDLSEIGRTKRLLAENRLELVGLHTNRSCISDEEAMGGFAEGRRILDAIAELDGDHLIISGEPSSQELGNLERLALIAENWGVRICYHNHYLEIEDGYKGLRRILESTDPNAVGLALDLGWVHRAGESAEDAVEEFIDRVEILHFKDVIGVLPEERDNLTDLAAAVEIGEGDLCWTHIVEMARDRGFSGWIVVEQDTTEQSPQDSSCQSRRYLREVCGI